MGRDFDWARHFDWLGHFDPMYILKYGLNTVIFLGLVGYLLKEPTAKFLKNRKEKMRSEVERAREAAERAGDTLDEYKAKLAAVSSEIESLTENIKKQGEAERKEIVAQAEKSRDAIKREVEDTIRLETARAVSEIHSEVVSSAVTLAEKMVKERVGRDFTESSVGDFVKTVEEAKWQRSLH